MNQEHNRAGPRLCSCRRCQQEPNGPTAEQHRSINRLVALADERSRRLLVGFLAEQHGRGGIALLSRITGLDRHTIARGQRELHGAARLPAGRIRQRGAGRKRLEVARPGS
jgi:hypothetical protein